MSDGDRALGGRRRTPAAGVTVSQPEDFDGPATGVLEGEALASARSKRPTEDRVARLELKHDELDAKHDRLVASVAEWRVETSENFGSIRGAIGELTGAVNGLKIVFETAAQRDHITFTAKVDIDKAKELDAIDAGKGKRELRNKLIAAGVTGSGLAAIVIKALAHWGVL